MTLPLPSVGGYVLPGSNEAFTPEVGKLGGPPLNPFRTEVRTEPGTQVSTGVNRRLCLSARRCRASLPEPVS